MLLDVSVTGPSEAHGFLQGTATLMDYYVMHDEIGFDADGLQGLTHALSCWPTSLSSILHMGNFNVLTKVEYKSEDNCKILYFNKGLSVLYKFLF